MRFLTQIFPDCELVDTNSAGPGLPPGAGLLPSFDAKNLRAGRNAMTSTMAAPMPIVGANINGWF